MICISIALLCLLDSVEGREDSLAEPFFFIVVPILCLVTFFGLGMLYRRLFPHGCPRIFDEIEMEDIYLENLDDQESNLKNKISDLKDQLAFHRKRKAANVADQDMRMLPIERQGLLKRRGEDIFDEIGWDETPEKPKSTSNRSPSPPSTKGKDEEYEVPHKQHSEKDENMWAQWDKIRDDKPKSPGPSPGKGSTAMSPEASASKRRVESILGQKTVPVRPPSGPPPVSVSTPPKGLSDAAKKRMEAYSGGSGGAKSLQPLMSPPSKGTLKASFKDSPAGSGVRSVSGGLGESFSQKGGDGYNIDVKRPAIDMKPILQKMVDNSKRQMDQSVKAAIQKNLVGQKARSPPGHVKPPASPPPPSRSPHGSKGGYDMSTQRKPPPPRGPPPPSLLLAQGSSKTK